MGKSKFKKLQINLTNRWLYTLIVFFSLVLVGVFVYAVVPNPGHSISAIEQPSGCTAGQFLKWTDAGWSCADVGADGGAETDPFWTGNMTDVAFTNKANTFGEYNQSFNTDTLFIDATNKRVGINTATPDYKLDVNGGVKANRFFGDGSGLLNLRIIVTPSNDICNESTGGLLRYRSGYCYDIYAKRSDVSVCMRTGITTYGWHILKNYSWWDNSCAGGGGCSEEQTYYECTQMNPGCYSSEPVGCYTALAGNGFL